MNTFNMLIYKTYLGNKFTAPKVAYFEKFGLLTNLISSR